MGCISPVIIAAGPVCKIPVDTGSDILGIKLLMIKKKILLNALRLG